jgi:polyisoprenoid-binding protein YceI
MATIFDIDPVNTFIAFSVPYLAISKVQGRFTSFQGVLEIDWDDLTRSTAHVRIETGSIATGHAERDAHLRSLDLLDVERFPEMVFHSAEVRRDRGALFEVTGTLYLHGVTRPVTLRAEYGGRASDHRGAERVGVLARGTIDRRSFGLTWDHPLQDGGIFVGFDVDLDLSIQGVHTG